MGKRTKKLTVLLLSAAMTVSPLGTAAGATQVFAAEDGSKKPIAEFTFDDEDGFKGAGAVAEAQNDYELTGDAVSGKALKLDKDKKQWLNVTDEDGKNVLSGHDELTVNYWIKTDAKGGNQGWTFYAASKEHAKPGYPNEKYLAVIDVKTGIEVQRWYNEGGRKPSIVSNDDYSGWRMVTITEDKDTSKLYVNGELKDTLKDQPELNKIIGGEDGIFQIGKANWESGEYLSATLDNYKVYADTLTADEIADIYNDEKAQLEKTQAEYEKAQKEEEEKENNLTDAERVEKDLNGIEIPNADDVRGNIYLASKGEKGSEISWKSSDSAVISDKDKGEKKAGVVTRQDKDTKVKLTATVTYGEATDTKEIEVTVKKAVEKKKTTHYLFANFKGEGLKNGEQIYFDDSEDGLHWNALNNGEPVLTSTLGEKGLRDPFIIRSPEGDKFYLIATDLNIHDIPGWGRAVDSGSKYIEIYESTDLVNWSEQRQAKVAIDDAGCTWAPEAFYDEERGEYFVFWASHVDGHHHIYYCTTRDFYNFSETKEWITLKNQNGDVTDIIDTTINSEKDENGKTVFYRMSKVEAGDNAIIDDGDPKGGKFEMIEKSDSLYGTWTRVKSKFLNDQVHVEGGTMFRFNEDDADKDHQWCLLLDNYGGIGYYPSYTGDLSSGEFTRYASTDYSFATRMRHGTVVQITEDEYKALGEKYGRTLPKEQEEQKEETKLVAEYSLDKLSETADGTELKNTVADGKNAEIVGKGAKVKNNALYLPGGAYNSGNAYVELPKELFAGQDFLTMSLWLKNETGKGDYCAMYMGEDSSKWNSKGQPGLYHILNPCNPNGLFKSVMTKSRNASSPWTTETGVSNQTTDSDWHLYTTVISSNHITGYYDGKKVSDESTDDMTVTGFGEALTAYVGRSGYKGDKLYKGGVRDIRVYQGALTSAEVEKLYKDTKREETADPDQPAAPTSDVKATDVKVDEIKDLTVDKDADVSLATKAEITFSDGTKKTDAQIVWYDEDGNKVTSTKGMSVGTHKLTGKLSYFGNPVIPQRADPYIVYNEADGYYYFTSSWPAYHNVDNGYDRLALRRSKTLEGLADAEDNIIWKASGNGELSHHIWAPELHKVNGTWYMFFAGQSEKGNVWSIRPYITKCTNEKDMLNPDSWTKPVRMTNADGSYTDSFDAFSLDMTTFNVDGTDYVVWAYKPNSGQISILKIAKLDSKDPSKLASDPVILTEPDYDWEKNGSQEIDEGPGVLMKGDDIFLTFSGSTTGPEYCMGMLSTKKGKDLLDPESWTKSPAAVLETKDLDKEYGPGHNNFTTDKDGNVILVYHSRDEKCYKDQCEWASDQPLYDPCRNANLAYVRWSKDGRPVFNNTETKETASLSADKKNFSMTVTVGKESDRVKADADALTILNADNVRGNIYLPEKGESGSTITWKSDDTSVVTDKAEGKVAAGKVTRSDKDKDVKLTATVKFGSESVTKEFTVHVAAAPAEVKTEDYIFAHFTGSESNPQEEQIYFSDSKDGYKWSALNDGLPVITSAMGEKGLRDPFIIRSAEGDRFYLLATDLSINLNGGSDKWNRAATKGSKSLMIWESDDLVNWSDQRMVKVATDNAGCTWAPEAAYNEETGEYYVYWSSDVDGIKHVYYAKTRDFLHFSEPELWISKKNKNGEDIGTIDTSVCTVKEDGKTVYYRLTKIESTGSRNLQMEESDPASGTYEFLERAESLDGPWTRVHSDFLNKNTGVEGGTIFKLNGEDKWVLLLDKYSTGSGYYPAVTDDLGSGVFTKVDANDYSFPATMRHGTAMPITAEEYAAIEKKWPAETENENPDTTLNEAAVAHFSFDDEESGFAGKGAVADSNNGYELTEGVNGNAVALDSAKEQWLNLTKKDGSALLTGEDEITINYWSKTKKDGSTKWSFYAAPSDKAQSGSYETYLGVIDPKNNNRLVVERYNNNGGRPSNAETTAQPGDEWKMVTIVESKHSSKLFINGKQVASVGSVYDLSDIFGDNGIVQIGKANWGSGEFFTGAIDEFTIFNRAVNTEEIGKLYRNEVEFTEADPTPVDPDPTPVDPDPTPVTPDPTPADPGQGTEPQKTAPQVFTGSVLDENTNNVVLVKGGKFTFKPSFKVKKYDLDKAEKKIMKISKSGKITLKKTGTVTVDIIGKNGENKQVTLYAECPAMKKLTVTSMNSINVSEMLTGVTYAAPTSYESSKKDVAEIDSNGVITIKKSGSAKITVKFGKTSVKATLKVKLPELRTKKKSVKVGSTVTLKIKNAAGNVKWVSSNPGVATVDADGNVYGVSKGTAEISAEVDGTSAGTCKVTVK
ncbi:Beta-xylosidase, GH43 family [Lachnospiraceae bacterium]|nr:Beta-xylosidase, GH43 family [Lachnospiraceae bacterium]